MSYKNTQGLIFISLSQFKIFLPKWPKRSLKLFLNNKIKKLFLKVLTLK